jgi:thiosulfate/3-mercaptopyruvate sulfurtransferase
MKILQLLLLLVLIASCNQDKEKLTHYSASKDDISAKQLVSVQEAHAMLSDSLQEKPILIQVSKKDAYLKEHIPQAHNIWRPQYSSSRNDSVTGLMATREQLESLLQSLGVNSNSVLLVYDTKGSVDAMRFCWVLELYGFDNYKIMNGGLTHWKQMNYPISTEIPESPSPSDFKLPGNMNKSSYVEFQEVLKAINNEAYLLIDTREDYEYLGQPFISGDKLYNYKKGAFERGRIPGAIHLNWSEFADLNNDHRIKSEKDLRYILDQKEISKDKKIIVYCQSGSRSSHTSFILREILGYPDVKNYDGSWIEWSYYASKDPDVPVQQDCSEEEFNKLHKQLALALGQNN